MRAWRRTRAIGGLLRGLLVSSCDVLLVDGMMSVSQSLHRHSPVVNMAKERGRREGDVLSLDADTWILTCSF